MSLAGMAAWRAMQTFDSSRGLKPTQWISYCVKISVWNMWRKKKRINTHETTMGDAAWECYVFDDLVASDHGINQEDFQMLIETHIDKWPRDVVARRHGITKYQCKRRIAAAEQRFVDANRV